MVAQVAIKAEECVLNVRAEMNVNFSIRSFIGNAKLIQISNIIHCDVTSAGRKIGWSIYCRNQCRNCCRAVQTSYERKGPQILFGWLILTIRLGRNSRSSTKGCFSTTKDRNKMADARERFVFRALRIVLRWFRDVAISYLIWRKSMLDSFTVLPDIRL